MLGRFSALLQYPVNTVAAFLNQPVHRPTSLPAVLTAVGLALSLWLILALVHELALTAVAALLRWLTHLEVVREAFSYLPMDEVHAQLALRFIGDMQVSHLAVRVPGNAWLATLLPNVFAPASLLQDNAWIGVVFAAGSSAVGVHFARLLVNVGFLVCGVIATARIAQRRSLADLKVWPRRLQIGFALTILAQAYGLTALLHMVWTGGSGGEILLSFIATKILGIDGDTFTTLVTHQGQVFSFALNASIAILVLLTALLLRKHLHRAPSAGAWLWRGSRLALVVLPHRIPGPLTLAAAVLLFQMPLNAHPTFAPAPFQPSQQVTAAPLVDVSGHDRGTKVERGASPGRPRIVTIDATRAGFVYRVDGKEQCIRGVGYNAMTFGKDSIEDPFDLRRQTYDRDFSLIRAAGANTILGWNQAEFDELLLWKAEQYGLGVILPFEFDPTWDYTSPSVRRQVMGNLEAWVHRYKGHPALRMWGLGNETIHDMGDPVRTMTPRAHAFARFLLQAADRVHALDATHPVVYRDAEDQYLKPVEKALSENQRARPWFVYGMNFFTYRLASALQEGPAVRLSQPLLISEFAPAGFRPADRPAGYQRLWDITRSFPRQVLGGAVYVWTTLGPEPLDRSFGLTDGDGAAVDGSYAAVRAMYEQDARAAATTIPVP